MKNRAVLLGGLLVLVCAFPVAAGAMQFKAGEQVSLAAGEAVNNDDLYMAGGSVSSAGIVGGDLITAGGNVLIIGPVGADLTVAGGSVTIVGDVGDDLRAAGGTVVVQGAVFGDVVIGGGQVSLTGTRIGGDVVAGASVITITAPVVGNVRIAAGEVTINAPIAGNVTIHADTVTLGPTAAIGGDLIYSALEPAAIAEGATVAGETEFTESEGPRTTTSVAAGIAAFATITLLAKFLMTLAGALALGYFFRRYAHELVAIAAARPWAEIGRGLVFLIVLPVASVILLATVIGIPLGILGFIAFATVAIFTGLMAPIVAGALVHKWIWKPAEYTVDWKTILIGAVITLILGLIPLIGWILHCALGLLTLGAMLTIKWRIVKEWR